MKRKIEKGESINLINQYINNIKIRKNKQELKEIYFFGYGFGIVIVMTFLIQYLFNDIDLTHDKYYMYGVAVGLIIICMTIIYPKSLKYPKKIFSKIMNVIFYFLYVILLAIIYYICVFPIGGILKHIKTSESYKEESNFSEYTNTKYSIEKKKRNRLFQALEIFRIFLKKENIILLPSLTIIIILGLVFVFLQSNIIAPFIYTLV